MNINKDINLEELKNKLQNEKDTLYGPFCSLPKSFFRKYKSINDQTEFVNTVYIEANAIKNKVPFTISEIDNDQSDKDQLRNIQETVISELNTTNQETNETEFCTLSKNLTNSSSNTVSQNKIKSITQNNVNYNLSDTFLVLSIEKANNNISKIPKNLDSDEISTVIDKSLNNISVHEEIQDLNILITEASTSLSTVVEATHSLLPVTKDKDNDHDLTENENNSSSNTNEVINLMNSPEINPISQHRSLENFSRMSPKICIRISSPHLPKKSTRKTLVYEEVNNDAFQVQIQQQPNTNNSINISTPMISSNLKLKQSPNSPILLPELKSESKICNYIDDLSELKKNEIIDLVSDDEEDYTSFISRVIAKHGLTQNFSPKSNSPKICEKTISLEENIPKTNVSPCKIPKFQISLEESIPKKKISTCKSRASITENSTSENILKAHKSPCKILVSDITMKKSAPIEADVASPIRVLSLRNRKINVSPSPKKSTPMRKNASPQNIHEPRIPLKDPTMENAPLHLSPSKMPLTNLIAKENAQIEATVASPVRVLSLRNRKIDVTPSPKKSTPRRRKRVNSPRI